MKLLLHIVIFATMALAAKAVIIPSDRRITWQGNVGIPGGITNRATIFANVKNSPYNAVGNGVANDTAAIQAALDACPAEQVVYIPTGTYKVTSALSIKGSYTVRGDGQGLTIINGNTSGGEVIGFGLLGDGHKNQYVFGAPGTPVNITSGTTLGSSNIVVSSASEITVGNFLNIDVINDTNGVGVTPIGNEGYQNTGGRTSSRMLAQIVLVTAKSGTSITIDPPLVWYFTNSPQAVPFPCQNKFAGVENLTVFNNNTGADNLFTFYSVACCWVKNIESGWADGDHLCVDSSARCEIRDSYFHDAYLHTPGSHDSTIRLEGHSSGLLLENNIIRRMHIGIMQIAGGLGSVIAYNFMTNQFDSGSLTAMFADVTYHGAHTMMTLFEGNVMNSFFQDGIWGTSSHGTLLRNFISGQDWICPPFTGRGAEQTGSYQKQFAAARCVNLAGVAVSKWFNVVGNVMGTSDMGNYPTFNPIYMRIAPGDLVEFDHPGYVFVLGYANGSDDGSFSGDNNLPWTTLINHGNWDSVTSSQMFSNNIADHVIPASYYLSSKPTWFGNLPWPSTEPTSPSTVTNMNPARYRFTFGTNPPAGGPDTTPPTLVSATIPAAGNVINLVFDEAVSIGAGGSGGWTVTMSGGAVTLGTPTGSGTTTLAFPLSRTVLSGETKTAGLSYTQPANGVEDLAGNDLATLTSAAVTNNSTASGGSPGAAVTTSGRVTASGFFKVVGQ